MEERELPVGWVDAQVGEICRLLNGRAYSKSELLDSGKYRVLRVGNLFTNPHWYHSDLELDDDKYCQAGDLLYAWSASFGPHVWKGEKVIYHYHIWKVEHDENLIHRDFLKAFFHWDTNRIKQQQGSGSTMLHVTKKSMEERAIPVPSASEQRRIAAKLDTTLAAVDACRQRLDGVADLLKRFRQAVLAAATSGELTREWREERGRDHSMEETRLGEVILEMRNGLSPKPTMNPPGVKILRIGAVRSGSIDWEDHRYLELSAKEVTAFGLQPDDLLFTRYNGTLEFVGVCARVGEISDQYVYPDKLIRARCDPGKVLPAYVEIAFGSDNVRSQVESLVKSSAGQKGISGGDLKVIRFSLPLIDEQQEIVRRAQELFTLADQLEARLATARKIVDRLTPALLAKAFRGELVPQDPEDESVSELLERIRAARQAEAGAGKPSRRGRPKAAATPAQLHLDAAPAPSDSLPPDVLACLLRECGPLSERALLAASELRPETFRVQLAREQGLGAVRDSREDDQVLLEAVG